MLNNNGQYGGSSKLIGISVFPLSDYFDGASPAHQHEIGHQWINFLANSATAGGSLHYAIDDGVGHHGLVDSGHRCGRQFWLQSSPPRGMVCVPRRLALPVR